MSDPRFKNRPYLPETINEPDDREQATIYREGIYRTIAYAVNARDFSSEPFRVSDAPSPLDLPRPYGSFVILVSGSTDGMPALIALAVQVSSSSQATIQVLLSSPGTQGKWNGRSLYLNSTPQGLSLRHDLSDTAGVFYVRAVT